MNTIHHLGPTERGGLKGLEHRPSSQNRRGVIRGGPAAFECMDAEDVSALVGHCSAGRRVLLVAALVGRIARDDTSWVLHLNAVSIASFVCVAV